MTDERRQTRLIDKALYVFLNSLFSWFSSPYHSSSHFAASLPLQGTIAHADKIFKKIWEAYWDRNITDANSQSQYWIATQMAWVLNERGSYPIEIRCQLLHIAHFAGILFSEGALSLHKTLIRLTPTKSQTGSSMTISQIWSWCHGSLYLD